MPRTLLLNQNIELSSPSPNIDWSVGDTFHLDTAIDETFTFSNVTDGRTILLIINNTDVAAHTMTFPAGAYTGLGFAGNVPASSEVIYTLLANNGKVYITETGALNA